MQMPTAEVREMAKANGVEDWDNIRPDDELQEHYNTEHEQGSGKNRAFKVKLNDLTFSLSGMENKVKQMAERGESKEEIARFALDTVCATVVNATKQAQERWPGLPVLCSGGVASNRQLRAAMEKHCGALFA